MGTRSNITITYSAVDGARGRRVYKGLKWARLYAHKMVGAHPEEGLGYAVSSDGIGRIEWSGCSFADLFPPQDPAEVAVKRAGIRKHMLAALAKGPRTFWGMSPSGYDRVDLHMAWSSLVDDRLIESVPKRCFDGSEPVWRLKS